MNKNYLFLYYLIFLLIIANKVFSYTIIDGVGLDDIKLSESNADDVIKHYGSNFILKNTSIGREVQYNELGLSFCYEYNDENKIIRTIIIYQPNSGKTVKGVITPSTTMEEIINIYGKPTWKPWKKFNGEE